MRDSPGTILVVGSLNTDYTVNVDRLPRSGETLCVPDATVSYGGKGANQAVQLAKLATPVRFVGCVGDDERGRSYCAYMESMGIQTQMTVTPDVPTGLSLAHCTREGEVSSTVISGANGRLTTDAVVAAFSSPPNLILVQNEVPREVVVAAGRLARNRGTVAVLNAAPYVDYAGRVEGLFDYFVVNEEEARAYSEWDRMPRDVSEWMKVCGSLRRLAPHIVVTLGARGSVYVGPTEQLIIPAVQVDAVDTMGAGDSFVAAMCAALLRGFDTADSLSIATRAGALTTMTSGAQDAMPDEEILFG